MFKITENLQPDKNIRSRMIRQTLKAFEKELNESFITFLK